MLAISLESACRLILLSLTERVGSIVPLAMFTFHFHLLCSSTNGSSPDIEGKEIGMHPVSADLISGWKTRARSQNQNFFTGFKSQFLTKNGADSRSKEGDILQYSRCSKLTIFLNFHRLSHSLHRLSKHTFQSGFTGGHIEQCNRK